MTLDLGTILAVAGALFAVVGLIPWLKAADRKAEAAKAQAEQAATLATAQMQALRITAVEGQRDDLQAKVDQLERRVDVQDQVIARLEKTIREALRHD